MDFDTKEIRKMEIKEKIKKEKPKKSKVATIVIILLVLMNLSLVTYIAYDKKLIEKGLEILTKKEKEPKKGIQEKREKLSLTSEEVNTLYSYLVPLKEKLGITSELDAKDLTEQDKIALSLTLLKEEDFEKLEEIKNGSKYRLKSIFLEEASMKILGEKITHQDIMKPYYLKYSKDLVGNVTMTYDDITSTYEVTFMDTKEESSNITKLVSATKKGSDITLEEKVIYTLEEDGKTKIYSNWQLSSFLGEKEKEEIKIEDYLEEASTIFYTFRKENGTYRFLSSKIKEKN